MGILYPYLPQDRLRALARGDRLPDRIVGSALFADISGFTPLTEVLTRALGPRRGQRLVKTGSAQRGSKGEG